MARMLSGRVMRMRRQVTRQERSPEDTVYLQSRAHERDDDDELSETLGHFWIVHRQRPKRYLRQHEKRSAQTDADDGKRQGKPSERER